MEVRASGHAGRSDIADHLALGDALAGRHLEAIHVRIGGGEAVAVIDLHIFAVPAVPADEFDATRCCREDRRSAGGAEIAALVHPRIAEQRMPAHAEARGPPDATDRTDARRAGK